MTTLHAIRHTRLPPQLALHWMHSICAGLVLTTGDWALATPVQDVPPAYQHAALRVGMPPAVLYAVALQESGMRVQGHFVPWPWTLSVAGKPQRYATRDQACAGLRQALTRISPYRIDAGLGQINVGYHAQRYRQPCELLDPYQNLAIAAEILHAQRLPGAGWLHAIGRYHRPAGGKHAARYRRSVWRHLARLLGPTTASTQIANQTVSP